MVYVHKSLTDLLTCVCRKMMTSYKNCLCQPKKIPKIFPFKTYLRQLSFLVGHIVCSQKSQKNMTTTLKPDLLLL